VPDAERCRKASREGTSRVFKAIAEISPGSTTYAVILGTRSLHRSASGWHRHHGFDTQLGTTEFTEITESTLSSLQARIMEPPESGCFSLGRRQSRPGRLRNSRKRCFPCVYISSQAPRWCSGSAHVESRAMNSSCASLSCHLNSVGITSRNSPVSVL